jgi:hypothetical protein
VFHMVGESGRSDQVQRRGPMQTNPEQPIEAGKMIHVGVRHETMRNAQELAAAAPANRHFGRAMTMLRHPNVGRCTPKIRDAA